MIEISFMQLYVVAFTKLVMLLLHEGHYSHAYWPSSPHSPGVRIGSFVTDMAEWGNPFYEN